MHRGGLVILAASLAFLAGCKGGLGGALAPGTDGRSIRPLDPPLRVEPLPVQQAKAYPETATGVFASLADFEDAFGGERGHTQVSRFTIHPAGSAGRRKFVVNITRTGAGAMEVVLPPQSELVFAIPYVHDFTGYRLLSMALYSRSLRDDLQVTLETDGAAWRSGRTLVRPGWNTILIDIQRLADVEGFRITGVRAMRIAFADAAGPVWLNLDDVMVIDNRRTIRPTPPGIVLRKNGLDYDLALPGRKEPIGLVQHADGLWRLRGPRAEIRLAAPGGELATAGEHLALMGRRRIGQVAVLEHNAVRLRLANTWYFPTRAGEWASLAVRKIRWEHTFYADGRWVAQATLNNAGGREVGSIGVFLPVEVAWSDGTISRQRVVRSFAGPVGRWQWLLPPPGPNGKAIAAAYGRPGRLAARIARGGAFAPGDPQRDGFDESQGCYFLAARAGQCRFSLVPPPGGLWEPAFRVAGRWRGPVHVSSEGLAVRPVVTLADGSALFRLPGQIRRPTAVEVTGEIGPPGD
jgi:hypothetical protein